MKQKKEINATLNKKVQNWFNNLRKKDLKVYEQYKQKINKLNRKLEKKLFIFNLPNYVLIDLYNSSVEDIPNFSDETIKKFHELVKKNKS